EPRDVAKFERTLGGFGQGGQKGCEPRIIAPEEGRKLVEDDPEPRAEPREQTEQVAERLRRNRQALAVRDPLRGFDGKAKRLLGRFLPSVERFGRRHSVEG